MSKKHSIIWVANVKKKKISNCDSKNNQSNNFQTKKKCGLYFPVVVATWKYAIPGLETPQK
jgi:hypothetical protein